MTNSKTNFNITKTQDQLCSTHKGMKLDTSIITVNWEEYIRGLAYFFLTESKVDNLNCLNCMCVPSTLVQFFKMCIAVPHPRPNGWVGLSSDIHMGTWGSLNSQLSQPTGKQTHPSIAQSKHTSFTLHVKDHDKEPVFCKNSHKSISLRKCL